MFVVSMKASKKKLVIILAAILIVLAGALFFLLRGGSDEGGGADWRIQPDGSRCIPAGSVFAAIWMGGQGNANGAGGCLAALIL